MSAARQRRHLCRAAVVAVLLVFASSTAGGSPAGAGQPQSDADQPGAWHAGCVALSKVLTGNTANAGKSAKTFYTAELAALEAVPAGSFPDELELHLLRIALVDRSFLASGTMSDADRQGVGTAWGELFSWSHRTCFS